ncbi:MAG: sugar transferase [Lachnospiraceae bacterium]|nr:sugar transferase [Lachnospiraceae bacterium]
MNHEDEIFAKLNSNRRKSDAMDMVRRLEAVLEVVLLATVFYLVWRLGYDERGVFPAYFGRGKYVLAGVYAVLLYLLCHVMNGFQFGMMKQTDIIFSQIIAMILANFVEYFILSLIANVMVRFLPILVLCLFDGIAIGVICTLYHVIYLKTHVPRRLLMIHGRNGGNGLDGKMAARPDKYRIEKEIGIEIGLDALRREAALYDGVVLNDVPAELRNDILKYCYSLGIRVYAELKLSDIIVRGGEVIDLFDTPLVLVRSRGITAIERLVKRLLDILVCLVGMIAALPVMGVIAAAIKLDDHGPVFYRQERVTEGGRKFMILKFRSMVVDAERQGEVLPASDNDARITRVGRVIRSIRMDELPQIFNILKGEMSIVGPRPERTEHVRKYLEEIPEFVYRYKVPAGLTGYAQIFGQYNTTAYDKLRLDMMYIEHYSLWLDFKLVLMTLRILFKKESTAGFEVTDSERQE